MNNYKLAGTTILSLLLLLGVHMYAMDNHLYIKIMYLDVFMHLLGGVCLALSTFFVFKKAKYIIPATIILGIIWEIFEVYFNLTGHTFGSVEYNIDTIKDIIMDTIGATFVWFKLRNK